MEDVRDTVREVYGRIGAEGRTDGACCAPDYCSSEPEETTCDGTASGLGYSDEEIASAPDGANLGLGCGNPLAIAELTPGQTVLDLGSGGGFDCFLAAGKVGESGKVIGVDMTAEMVSRARKNAAAAGTRNVEFRLGEIEHLPLADETVDVIMSNCVINLSPDKGAVFNEAYRVLRTGGRLAIMDIVATVPLPQELRDDVELHASCIAGAATVDEHISLLSDAGFVDVRIEPREESRAFIRDWLPGLGLDRYIVSVRIQARRP